MIVTCNNKKDKEWVKRHTDYLIAKTAYDTLHTHWEELGYPDRPALCKALDIAGKELSRTQNLVVNYIDKVVFAEIDA